MTQSADNQPGNYYVTARDDLGRHVCLAGPFRDDHAAALALVKRATDLACDCGDPKAWFYSYGTMRAAYTYDRAGVFNAQLGIT